MDATTCREANPLGFFSACQPFEALALRATISSRSGGRFFPATNNPFQNSLRFRRPQGLQKPAKEEIPRIFALPCRYSVPCACGRASSDDITAVLGSRAHNACERGRRLAAGANILGNSRRVSDRPPHEIALVEELGHSLPSPTRRRRFS